MSFLRPHVYSCHIISINIRFYLNAGKISLDTIFSLLQLENVIYINIVCELQIYATSIVIKQIYISEKKRKVINKYRYKWLGKKMNVSFSFWRANIDRPANTYGQYIHFNYIDSSRNIGSISKSSIVCLLYCQSRFGNVMSRSRKFGATLHMLSWKFVVRFWFPAIPFIWLLLYVNTEPCPISIDVAYCVFVQSDFSASKYEGMPRCVEYWS